MAQQQSAAQMSEEERQLCTDLLHGPTPDSPQYSAGVVGSIIYCISLAGYAAVAVAAPWIFNGLSSIESAILCSCNILFLILTGLFQQYLSYQVKTLRSQGYYIFSQKLKPLVHMPFATISCGTAIMLLMTAWRSYITIQILSFPLMLRIVMVIEVICAGCFMSLYIGHIHQYNSMNGQPDVLKSLYSALHPESSLEGVRYYGGGSISDQQMALLQYQQENIHYLSEEILRLQESLSKYEQNDDGTTPSVDLAHLLAARDQESRVLVNEVKQVQSELHLARDLIAERESEVQRIRAVNSQYIEENERLRAILGEWSTRAAKLERALEAEHTSNIELQKKITMLRHAPPPPANRVDE